MENKIRILNVLEKLYKANSSIEYKRLDMLINSELFNLENDKPLWGSDLLILINELREEKLIFQDEEKKYFITKKGLEYLSKSL